MSEQSQGQIHLPDYERPRIGITIGDLNGIGPEIILKTFADGRILRMGTPIIYGSAKVLRRWRKFMDMEDLPIHPIQEPEQAIAKKLNLITCWEEDTEVVPGKPSAESGQMAYKALVRATADAKAGKIHAIVTGPIHKANMPAEFAAKGHTDFLEKAFGVPATLMVMASEVLKVAVVSHHIPLKDVAAALSIPTVSGLADLFIKSLKKDFGIQKPKLAILGLNPHAGESGTMGTEEKDIIIPALIPLKEKYTTVLGPFPADAFFAQHLYRKFDGVLAMYHDQGLIPFKALVGADGVNFTAGLPIVRTSPAHGTAFDIAGQNVANPDSFRSAYFMAADAWQKRQGR